MHKTLKLLVVFLFIGTTALAQTKELTLKDAIWGRYREYNPTQLHQLSWVKNGKDTYSYVEKHMLIGKNIKGKEVEYTSTIQINNALRDAGQDTLKQFPTITWINPDEIRFTNDNHFNLYQLKTQKIAKTISIKSNGKFADFNPDSRKVAFTVDNNLWVADENGMKAVTTDQNPGIVNGQYVHRREFGITKGTFWSPKGDLLAFYRKDETMVRDYPIVDFMTREAELKSVKYPMAGMKSHHVTVGVYNCKTQKTVFLKTGKPLDHYLTNISWGPAEKYIYIAELNRDQDHMKLNQYNAVTGEFVKTLYEETSDTYVEPLHPIVFSKTNPNHFYRWSRKDGYFHVYLYDTSGKMLKQITKGPWEVTNILGFDPAEKYMYFVSTKESPIDRNIYKVQLSNGKVTRLDTLDGTHQALLSEDGKYLLDTYQSKNVPRVTNLITNKGKVVRNLLTAANTLKDFRFGKNSIFTIKAADGKTDLYCRMILPADFDSTKKYPVIVYVYGGPHAQLVRNTWHNNARFWQYYMAQKGYIAFTVDNRGSDNRGAAFEDIIHRHLGINETADQMKGIEYLESLPYVDKNRIGVHGWSFGGFMTLNLMLRHPEVFKVGVAGGPVVDWKMYEVMYGERYMDTPQENPEGYKECNMLNHVSSLKGKLMLIHGAEDQTVVMQQSMKFLRECIKQQKQVDFFVYPTSVHNVHGIDRVHLMRKVSDYFLENL